MLNAYFQYNAAPLLTLWKNNRVSRAWITAFAAATIVHITDIATFPLGNHDWFRLEDLLPDAQMQAGRPIAALSYFLTGNALVPLVYILGVALAAASGVGAVWCIARRPNVAIMTMGGIFIAVIPYVTPLLFYRASITQYFLATFLAILAVIVLRRQSALRFFAGSFLVFGALGTYGVAICTIAVTASGLIMSRAQYAKSIDLVREGAHIAGGIAAGIFAYFLYIEMTTLFWGDFYSTNSRSLPELLRMMPDVWVFGAQSLLPSEKHLYMPTALKTILFLCLVAAAALVLRRALKVSISNFIIAVAACSALIFGVKFYALLTDSLVWWAHRGMLFGVGFAYLVGVCLLLDTNIRPFRIAIYVVVTACLWMSVVQDMRAAQHLRLMVNHDTHFMNRVVARIEVLSIVPGYQYLQIGEIPSYRSRLVSRDEYTRLDHPFTNTSQHPGAPGNLIRYISALDFAGFRFIHRPHGYLRDRALNYQLLAYAMENRWPAQGAVIEIEGVGVLAVLATSDTQLSVAMRRLEPELLEAGYSLETLRAEALAREWRIE